MNLQVLGNIRGAISQQLWLSKCGSALREIFLWCSLISSMIPQLSANPERTLPVTEESCMLERPLATVWRRRLGPLSRYISPSCSIKGDRREPSEMCCVILISGWMNCLVPLVSSAYPRGKKGKCFRSPQCLWFFMYTYT